MGRRCSGARHGTNSPLLNSLITLTSTYENHMHIHIIWPNSSLLSLSAGGGSYCRQVTGHRLRNQCRRWRRLGNSRIYTTRRLPYVLPCASNLSVSVPTHFYSSLPMSAFLNLGNYYYNYVYDPNMRPQTNVYCHTIGGDWFGGDDATEIKCLRSTG